MKKGKLTATEVACIKGMISEKVSEQDMANQLDRSLSLIEKEVKRIAEEAVRDQLMIRKTARGEGGIVAMTEAASMKGDDTRSQPATEESPTQRTQRGKWVHTIYDKS
jgi:IS30 family transposase|tara:strand:+ start:50125 stop:50448 length:324 start_codon:yes stop_codon:yes gene_type:complete